MNCRPNDIAVVVSVDGNPDLKHLLGKIREVKKVESAWDGPAWTYKGRRFKAKGLTCYAIPDRWLRPIRSDGITKEEVSDLYAPQDLVHLAATNGPQGPVQAPQETA